MRRIYCVLLVLILCLSFLVVFVPKIKAQSTNIFGYDVIGSYSDDALDWSSVSPIILCNYTSPSDLGTITQMSVYMNSTSSPIEAEACIYNGSFAFLASSANVTVGTTPSWVNFTLNYDGSPNTEYWFGVFASGDFNFYWDSDSTATHVFTWTTAYLTFDNFTDTFVPNPVYSGNDILSIYATYTPAISPTPTSSPAPTPTASPTPSPTPTSSPAPTPTASPTPSPTPTSNPTPTPTASAIPSPTSTPTPSPTPALPELTPSILLLTLAILACLFVLVKKKMHIRS